jgi:hypothetical protein
MSERDEALKALHVSVGTVDPLHAASEGYAGAIREVQKITRAQGHVMSEALDNNARLWEDRKRILAENSALKHSNEQLTKRCARMERELSERKEAHAALEVAGGDRYKALYEQSRKTLNMYLSDALDEDQLAERQRAMDTQRRALDNQGLPQAHVPDGGAIEEYIADAGDL